MRYVFVVCLTASCAATPTELRYTATYAYTDAQVGAQILAALQAQKLEVAQVDPRRGAFITLPTKLDLTDEVETGFLVTFRRNNDSRTKLELTVIELDGGELSFAMVLRTGEHEHGGHKDISAYGSWRAYRASMPPPPEADTGADTEAGTEAAGTGA